MNVRNLFDKISLPKKLQLRAPERKQRFELEVANFCRPRTRVALALLCSRLFLLRLLRRVTENCESLIEQTAKDIVSCVLEHFHFCYPWLKCTSHQKSTQQTIYNQSESIRRLFSSKRSVSTKWRTGVRQASKQLNKKK